MKIILAGALIAALWTGSACADRYRPYAATLQRYVDAHGRVDYAGLKGHRADLDVFMAEIAATDSLEYATWSENDRLAYWINAYNAFILTMVIDNYPIQRAAGHSGYPDGSVQQLPNPWKQARYTVMGEKRSPDGIENGIIRATFAEPRIHAALVCGAVSCPPLRREPYRGEMLDRQLDDQFRRFFADPHNFRVGREHGDVYASRIFDWFYEDFAPGVKEKEGEAAARRGAVVNAAAPCVDAATRTYLEEGDFSLTYLDYDWHLNEQHH